MEETKPLSIASLITIPALITLGITILRLVGELQHWPKPWFNASAGGGGAIIGISWLPLIFGPYFALKLARAGDRPSSAGKSIGLAFAGLAVMVVGIVIMGVVMKMNHPSLAEIGYLVLLARGVYFRNRLAFIGEMPAGLCSRSAHSCACCDVPRHECQRRTGLGNTLRRGTSQYAISVFWLTIPPHRRPPPAWILDQLDGRGGRYRGDHRQHHHTSRKASGSGRGLRTRAAWTCSSRSVCCPCYSQTRNAGRQL